MFIKRHFGYYVGNLLYFWQLVQIVDHIYSVTGYNNLGYGTQTYKLFAYMVQPYRLYNCTIFFVCICGTSIHIVCSCINWSDILYSHRHCLDVYYNHINWSDIWYSGKNPESSGRYKGGLLRQGVLSKGLPTALLSHSIYARRCAVLWSI